LNGEAPNIAKSLDQLGIALIEPVHGRIKAVQWGQRKRATGMGKAMVRADPALNRRGTGPIAPFRCHQLLANLQPADVVV
jgi:hypothetical protein